MSKGASIAASPKTDDDIPVRRRGATASMEQSIEDKTESKLVGKAAYEQAIQLISKMAKKLDFEIGTKQQSRQRFYKDTEDGREFKLYESGKGVTIKFQAPKDDGSTYRSPKIIVSLEQAVELAETFFGAGDLSGAVKYVKKLM